MNMALRLMVCAALLLPASRASAANGVPGLEVVASNGSAKVFQGLTDGSGRFSTGPLPPGMYKFEVRVPKTFITPARYFLALSGARPLGEPMMSRGVAVAMDAQVRRVGEVRGQVTARPVMIVPAANSAPAATTTVPRTAPSPAPAPAAMPTRSAVPVPGPRPMGILAEQQRLPAATAPAVAKPAVTTTTARAATTASPRPMQTAAPQPMLIDGKLHVWVPSAPGSLSGRWVPQTAPATAAPRATSSTTTAPRAQTSPAKPRPR